MPKARQIDGFDEKFKVSKESGKIMCYENDYLLEPIHLEVKMKQFDPAQALAKVASALTLDIHLKSLGICLQKAQYDNLLRLLELTNDFMRFCNTAALK
jgi:hypothetical protein